MVDIQPNGLLNTLYTYTRYVTRTLPRGGMTGGMPLGGIPGGGRVGIPGGRDPGMGPPGPGGRLKPGGGP